MFTATYLGLELKDWVMVIAVLMGPVLAVQAQKIVEKMRDKRNRRLQIFKTLMSTRAERVSREHVQALNLIDIEFYGSLIFGIRLQTKREKAITNAWKNYNSHLNDKSYLSLEEWYRDGDSLFTKMLYEISQALGYDFDEVQLKRDAYKPEAHVNLENSQITVLDGLAKVLSNQNPLSVKLVPSENQKSDKSSDRAGNKRK